MTPIPAGWKPIESAPTLPEFSDGLHRYGPNILVFAAGKVTIARWWQTLDGSASNFIDRGSCAVHPTHWMPLPAAPSPASVAPGDAQDLTLAQKYEDACIFANANARDAARWRFIRRKLCLTGNGDGTCAMHAINLPASIPGWPEPGPAVAEFCDAAIDAAIAYQQDHGGAA